MKQLPKSIQKADPKSIIDANEWFGTTAERISAKEKVRKPNPQRLKLIILPSKINEL